SARIACASSGAATGLTPAEEMPWSGSIERGNEARHMPLDEITSLFSRVRGSYGTAANALVRFAAWQECNARSRRARRVFARPVWPFANESTGTGRFCSIPAWHTGERRLQNRHAAFYWPTPNIRLRG